MNQSPTRIERVHSFEILARGYEFCFDHDIDLNRLQFFQFQNSVDVFVGGE